MKDVPVRLGPLALLLAVISICMTVLGVLTCATARADMNLAEKYADTVRSRYSLEKTGQEWLSGFLASPAAPPADAMLDEDGIYRREWTDGEGMILRAGVRIGQDGQPVVVEWRYEREWTEDTSIGKLWDGKIPG